LSRPSFASLEVFAGEKLFQRFYWHYACHGWPVEFIRQYRSSNPNEPLKYIFDINGGVMRYRYADLKSAKKSSIKHPYYKALLQFGAGGRTRTGTTL